VYVRPLPAARIGLALAVAGCIFFTPAAVLAERLESSSNCQIPLQAQLDAAPEGSTLQAPPCVYRETVTIKKPLVLLGGPGVEIRGSDVWNDWKRDRTYWRMGPAPLAGSDSGPCRSGNACQLPYQVFIDGRQLVQVAGAPKSGQFAIDKDRDVVLADDPAGHLVEVSTRPTWVIVAADNVVIDGFTMQHAVNQSQSGALIADGVSNVVVRNSDLGYAHGVDVQFLNGGGDHLLNNDIHHAGQLGVSGYQTTQVMVQGNRIHENNTAGYDADWEAGGLKFSSSSEATFDGNEVYLNAGHALWCDIGCQNLTYTRNRVHDNTHMGIVVEISNGASISDNAVWNNASAIADGWGCDIFVSSSSNIEVMNNTVLATSTHGVLVVSQNRTEAPGARTVTNVQVHDNVIVMNRMFGSIGRTGVGWLQDWAGTLFNPELNNRGFNNSFSFS
jgi:parallel beta-helix repeat protein